MEELTEVRSTAAPADAISGLVDAVIEQAPLLLRQRMLLPAIDWKRASPQRVTRLLQRLGEADIKLPAWLATSLLAAGHVVSLDQVRHLAQPLQWLATLNAAQPGGEPAEFATAVMHEQQQADGLDAEVAVALVARLAELDQVDAACRLALAHAHRVPGVLKPVRRQLATLTAAMPALRLRVTGVSTTHPFAEGLRLAFAAVGRRAELTEAGFGELIAELMRGTVDADALLVLLDFDGLYGNDWRDGLDHFASRSAERLDALILGLKRFTAGCAVPVLINTLPSAVLPAIGHVDHGHRAGASHVVETTNRRLGEIAAITSNIGLVDGDMALSRIAPADRTDAKLWYYGRIAYTEDATRALSNAFAATWRDRARSPAKVLALDFDNTLWGGVYGDDGIDRLTCGDDFPGNAFKALQQEALRLKGQGMLLVALSKNNADAIEVFGRHHGMALRADDFAATAIDWQPKPVNIERLARELNLGLDSFLFLDDSPHEREAMRRMCPTVIVPEMPADPAARPQWLRAMRCTWPLRLTDEDSRRSEMYVAERRAKALKESASSYDDYLKGLEQRLLLASVGPAALARVAQLHQRTNQFNLTTRRFTEAELAALASDPAAAVVLQGRVVDKFGDHGITIAAVATIAGDKASIDSLLMSCRVVSRHVETACLGALIGRLVERGVETIVGSYKPTAKNGMVRDFFAAHGFHLLERRDDETTWVWRSGADEVPSTLFVAIDWSDI